MRPEDPELQRLVDQVMNLLGEPWVCGANNRAYDLAAFAKDGDAEEWYAIFTDQFKAELRRLLRPH
jgi:hypothetical protein